METSELLARPQAVQLVKYTTNPEYYKHQANEDKLAILVCQIKIWEPVGTDWFTIPKANECLTIRECNNIEITDTAKDLIGKAVIKFSRGTVIAYAGDFKKKVAVGNKEDKTASEKPLGEATNYGEVTGPGTSIFSETGYTTVPIESEFVNRGLLDMNKSKKDYTLLGPKNVAIGNRIEVRLGYAYSEQEFKQMNASDNAVGLDIAFTGFITSISADTPLEIECTNMAHVLACVSVPNIKAATTIKVRDFLDENGPHQILKDTGIKLSEDCNGLDITVSGGTISDNLTVADVLSVWNKSAGVISIMDIQPNGSVELKVGLGHIAGLAGLDAPNQDKRYIASSANKTGVALVQFDWDVAQDKLNIMRSNKKYLAVEATGRAGKDKQFFKLTIRKQPNTDSDDWEVSDEEGEFQVVNEQTVKNNPKPKKPRKSKSGTKRLDKKIGKKINPSKLKQYTIIPYFSTKVPITPAELIAEAKQYWAKYNPNGITGSLTLFGDVPVKPTQMIGLIDPRQPEKNGYYYVEAVSVSFGTNGYRREITLPYKIANFEGPVEIIR